MSDRPTVFVVDDDAAVRDSLRQLIETMEYIVQCFPSAEAFLQSADRSGPGCLVLDLRMPGMSGMELHERLNTLAIRLPVIFVTGHAEVSQSVRAMKNGAVDFLEKPYAPEQLIDAIRQALKQDTLRRRTQQAQESFDILFASLTDTERQIMEGILLGKTNHQIAEEIDLSLRTVQYRRASIMKKLKVETKPELIKLAKMAG